ncbi:MAG: cyclic pyranopterin monophosphate synthase MoaC [Candidatus Bathyarchaeota archaeon]|nr:MAG: cyclic pyranopterin monophosphate synthase MoaC [Candidatus Bathyarchaeota archaeon]
MVDVSGKRDVLRAAVAKGRIQLKPATIHLIKEQKIAKGDVFSLSRVAGILSAKKTSDIIPLCHPLPLSAVDVSLRIVDESHIEVNAEVKALAKTGVEMEALVAVSTALLTIWDMTKQYEKDPEGQYPTTLIDGIQVTRKVKRE